MRCEIKKAYRIRQALVIIYIVIHNIIHAHRLFVRKMMMMCSCIFHISSINCDKSKVFV